MRPSALGLSLILISASAFAQIKRNCTQFAQKSNVAALLTALDKMETSVAGISDYRISNHPVILFDSINFPGCKLTRLPHKKLIIENSDNPKISNGVYDFCGPNQTTCPTVLHSPLSQGAVVLDIGELSVKIKELYNVSGDKISLIINLALLSHEGFHYFIQSGIFGPLFPSYSTNLHSENRPVVSKQCYDLNDDVAALTKKEFDSLFLALLAGQKSDFTAQKKLLSEFISTRELRYTLTASVKINDERSFDCRMAESRMEVAEGIAEFAGLWPVKQILGWNDVNLFYEIYQKDFKQSDEHYYRLGSLQIFNLILSGHDTNTIFQNILNSKTVLDPVYGQTKKYFSSIQNN